MDLNAKQRSYLRGLAHHLNPLVQMGKAGLTPAILKEIDRNLSDHELIKVRIACDDRQELASLTQLIASEHNAAIVQVIGHIAIFYRPAEEPKISLPA